MGLDVKNFSIIRSEVNDRFEIVVDELCLITYDRQ